MKKNIENEVTKIKIWFKGYTDNELTLSRSYDFEKGEDFFDLLTRCCGDMDLPVPVILDKHEKYLEEFSVVKFSGNDFIEQLDYDALEVEIYE